MAGSDDIPPMFSGMDEEATESPQSDSAPLDDHYPSQSTNAMLAQILRPLVSGMTKADVAAFMVGLTLGLFGFFLFGLDLLHTEDLLAFLFFELLFDVLLVLVEVGKQFELKGVDAAFGRFNFLEHLLHRRFDLGGEDDRFEQFLVGVGGLVDPS